jgi:folate-binding Fe-S cluster repair protein YgfZ
MHHRDKLRRRLLPVTIDGVVEDGAAITVDGLAAGELRSHVGSRGIAYLKVEAAGRPLAATGAMVTVDWPGWLPRE